MVTAIYSVGKKSPHTKQCAIIINFNHLCTSWLHFQRICMHTMMLATQGIFHSSAQLCIGGVATCSHTLPLILPIKVLSFVIRSVHMVAMLMVPECQWTTADTAALLKFVQNVTHKKREMCMCLIIWAPISKPKLSHISNPAEKDAMLMNSSKKYSPYR